MDIPPIPSQATPPNLQTRVVNMLMKPAQEWPVIAAEPRDIAGLYRNYIVILAAIPAICGLIGMSVIGISLPLVGYVRVGIGTLVAHAVINYVLMLVGVYVSALVIAKLAPNFQSESDVAQALKLVAYSLTPGWVAGVLMLVPALGILGLLAALYGLYIMYLGFGPLMKTPSDKTITYMVVSLVVVIVLYVIAYAVAGAVAPIGPRLTL
jgi:hypothetical protein